MRKNKNNGLNCIKLGNIFDPISNLNYDVLNKINETKHDVKIITIFPKTDKSIIDSNSNECDEYDDSDESKTHEIIVNKIYVPKQNKYKMNPSKKIKICKKTQFQYNNNHKKKLIIKN
uniref:Uncharacterized protein n=1 Tax=viral metagenome TaxID=1070528 RepID=A0A6C0LUQ8_9ZZZZ